LARGAEVPAPPVDIRAMDAVIFDLDGVVTSTATVHAEAWKRLFDEYLLARAGRLGEPFEPFDLESDYRRFIDGKPRQEGVRSFLASRGIELPLGAPDDPEGTETVWGLGNRKNRYFHEALERTGPSPYPTTLELIADLRARGVRTAIASSSRNCIPVLEAAGIRDLFDVKVDGIDLADAGLAGKPDPALFLEAARRLGVDPGRAAVVEDALSGVEAGRRGNFGLVIGLDRGAGHDALLAAGADVVVSDLAEVAP
jgi:alpha,alpha-trehalase